jgi:hypothetical protein
VAFGQQSGLPASAQQVRELLGLLQAAGHIDFRDARGPMGFTQRQAAGKFSRDEAAALIDRLENGDGLTATVASQEQRPPGEDAVLRRVPAERLGAELERRGWIVIPP